jgi:hypothetical protein
MGSLPAFFDMPETRIAVEMAASMILEFLYLVSFIRVSIACALCGFRVVITYDSK